MDRRISRRRPSATNTATIISETCAPAVTACAWSLRRATLTFRFGAPLGEIDSDIDPETGVSDVFRLQSGETRLNIDVGLTERAEK